MPLTVDWANKIINVPKSYTQLVTMSPSEIRSMDIDVFRLDLKALEAEATVEGGMSSLDTHLHVTTFDLGDGTTLARSVKIINGYTVTFEDGQYRVNLVGANSNIATSTNVNQVSVSSSNSAGLVHIEQILNQSFGGRVWIDKDGRGLPGTIYPRGTPTDPVDNYADAFVIATNRKLFTYALEGTLTLIGSDDIEDTDWYGNTHVQSHLIVGGNSTQDCSFRSMVVEGDLNGNCVILDSHLRSLTNFCGSAHNTILENGVAIILDTCPTQTTQFLDCWSGVAGTGTPTLDLAAFTAADSLIIRNYTGGLKLKNLTVASSVSIDMLAGAITLESNVTAGTIVVRGVCDFTDNSVGATVITDGLIDAPDVNAILLEIRAKANAIIGLV